MHSFMLPKLITPEQYPNCFLAPICKTNELFDDDALYNSSSIPSHVKFLKNYDPKEAGLEEFMDPKYSSTPPKLYEHRYSNDQGVDIVIRGSHNDVISTVNILNMYPPQKIVGTPEFDLLSGNLLGSTSLTTTTTISPIGIQRKGKHLLVKIDEKVYSGSGSLIIVIQKNKPITIENAKIILFRDVKTSQYQDLGGKIDNPSLNKLSPSINKDILFENSKKETHEESMCLFEIKSKTGNFLDIESQVDNVYYRIHLYVIRVDNINQLPALFEQNKLKIMEEYSGVYKHNESYRETDDLKLFDLLTFINKLNSYGIDNTNISNGVFYSINGTNHSVGGRVMKAISKLDSNNVFSKVIDPKYALSTVIGLDGDKVLNSITF